MGALKAVWGVLITIMTVVLLYGQYRTENATLRPALVLSTLSSTEKFLSDHGPYSHEYLIENSGSIPAKRSTITVITRQGGSTPHRDDSKSLGDLMPNQKVKWVNHVHGIVEDSPGRPKYSVTEDVELVYVGKNILRFWCDPVYTVRMTFLYDDREKLWVRHIDKNREESVQCD